MKAILASNCYNCYADFNKNFDNIYTHSSCYQVGAAILQGSQFLQVALPLSSARSHSFIRLDRSKSFVWNEEHQKAFDAMKAILASNCYNCYADFNKNFDNIYTHSSCYQVGAAILQDGHPIVYFSKKLSQAQLSYLPHTETQGTDDSGLSQGLSHPQIKDARKTRMKITQIT